MNERLYMILTPENRERCIERVRALPDGSAVIGKEKTRSLEQNSKLWPMLGDFSGQVPIYLNGAEQFITDEDWKDILSGAFMRESERVAFFEGRFFLLGQRTRHFTKRQFSEFIEFLYATGAHYDVSWSEKSLGGSK